MQRTQRMAGVKGAKLERANDDNDDGWTGGSNLLVDRERDIKFRSNVLKVCEEEEPRRPKSEEQAMDGKTISEREESRRRVSPEWSVNDRIT